ncbi:Ig-like domain repeat protein [Granulicella sibirica]|uniref:Fibronectin type III domain protein n=1 Tax=Granulicella sibirica TaxID=2479048 RepID=A0A4Q0T3L7_9BACT|nr:Ig-like domain repeat protein [Granulicella sibirica]RXH56141.1 fibronectin type III domain protein [Granulicella sibirica]
MANLSGPSRFSPAFLRLYFVFLLMTLPALSRAQRVTLQTRAVQAGGEFVDAGAAPASQPMTLTVRLAIPADRAAALKQRLLDQQDSASPEYRRWLTPTEFGVSFGATDAQLAAATAWLQSQSLTVSGASAARTTLTVTGTAGQVQAAFAVSLRQLQRGTGTFFANATQPSLPVDAATLIAGVSGLDDVPSAVGFGSDASADPVAAIAGVLDANSSSILIFAGTACSADMAQADVDTYTALLRQANAQGVTVLAANGCTASGQGFPAGLSEGTGVALSGGTAFIAGTSTETRPAWQVAPGLPADGFRYAPDLAVNSLDAFARTVTTLVQQAGTRLGNINETLYRLGPVPGLYTQADGAAAGTWETATGLGLVDLAKLLTVFPHGTGQSYTSLTSSAYSAVHGTSITLSSTVTTGTGGATPTGTVTFATSAGVTLGSSPLVNGTASYSTATLPGGMTTVVANYSGDGTYATSVSPSAGIFVQPEASVLSAVVSTGNVVGGMYTVAVTDSAGSGVGVPAGTITVILSGTSSSYMGTLAPAGASSSMATISIPAATVGTATLSINCSGDASYSCGNVLTKTVTIGKATPTLGVSYTPDPPVSGASISFTATLAAVGTAPVPTGNVSFFDGTTTINAGKLANGTVTVSGTDITVATHSISATYDGDANYLSVSETGATSAGTTATTTALTSSSAIANGTNITFTAVVAPSAIASTAPTGMVSFYDGTTLLGTGVLTSNMATYATAALDQTTTHTITAVYSGDTLYKGSTSAVLVIASGSTSSTAVTGTLAASILPVSAAYNSTAVVTAAVTIPSGSTLPAGSMVTAQITGLTGTYKGELVASTATTATAAISVPVPIPGMYSVAVSCVATSAFVCSNAPSVSLTANKGVSVTTLVEAPPLALAGQSITLTATVAASTASTPLTVAATGMVTFYDAGVSIGMGTLSATGVATLATTVGTGTTHLYTATYAGDTNYLTSTSTGVSLTPAAVAPTIVLSSSAASTLAGLNVVLSAQVVGPDAAAAIPTGMVSFYDTSSGSPVLLGTAALAPNASGSAAATFSSNGLADGTHTIYAIYSGDASYLTVTSAMITVAVSDYNVGFTPQTLSLLQGATGSVTVPVTAVGTFQGTVSFACTPPAGTETTCSFSPATLNGVGQATLTITTTAPAGPAAMRAVVGTFVAVLVFFGVPGRKRRRLGSLLVLALGICLTSGLGCGDGTKVNAGADAGSPLGTTFFAITAAGTDGGNTVRHTYQFQVTIHD